MLLNIPDNRPQTNCATDDEDRTKIVHQCCVCNLNGFGLVTIQPDLLGWRLSLLIHSLSMKSNPGSPRKLPNEVGYGKLCTVVVVVMWFMALVW
jgi:hypothetical protein